MEKVVVREWEWLGEDWEGGSRPKMHWLTRLRRDGESIRGFHGRCMAQANARSEGQEEKRAEEREKQERERCMAIKRTRQIKGRKRGGGKEEEESDCCS